MSIVVIVDSLQYYFRQQLSANVYQTLGMGLLTFLFLSIHFPTSLWQAIIVKLVSDVWVGTCSEHVLVPILAQFGMETAPTCEGIIIII